MTTRLRTTWNDGRTAFGLWFSTDAPSAAEALAALDFDYVVIDLQHGLMEVSDAIDMMRAMARSDATLLCRVPVNEPGIIGRVLDAGAAGVIVPMVNDVDDADAAVRAAKYAPRGDRSFGPTRARLVGGSLDIAEVDATTIVIPMIETAEAISNVDAIAAIDGIDALYVGPSDLGITLGIGPGNDHDDARFGDALDAVLGAARANGIAPAIHSDARLAKTRADQGFTMVTAVTDTQAVVAGATQALEAARSTER